MRKFREIQEWKDFKNLLENGLDKDIPSVCKKYCSVDVERNVENERKLYENLDFPQKRVQKFSPASGKPSMNKVARKLSKFIDEAFNEDGSHTTNTLLPTPSKKACKWCEFNQTEYCNEGVR